MSRAKAGNLLAAPCGRSAGGGRHRREDLREQHWAIREDEFVVVS
jgi:hypothetical protein